MSKQRFDPEDITNFLTEQRDDAPAEVQPIILDFEDLWERKLWHQLTEKLLEYFAMPESKSQRLPLYNKFILSFADKINQLKLVKLALSASTQCEGTVVFLNISDRFLTVPQMMNNVLNSSKHCPNELPSQILKRHMFMRSPNSQACI